MTTREIPDGPEANCRFMVIVTCDGYGRPRQVEKEFREALEKVLLNEFGKQARITSVTKMAWENREHDSLDTVEGDSRIVNITDSTGDTDEDPSGIH